MFKDQSFVKYSLQPGNYLSFFCPSSLFSYPLSAEVYHSEGCIAAVSAVHKGDAGQSQAACTSTS